MSPLPSTTVTAADRARRVRELRDLHDADGLPALSFNEIARIVGLSPQRCQQIIARQREQECAS